MEFVPFGNDDYGIFHTLANAYYREGEDAQTPQDVIDSFIRILFDKVINGEIYGCLARSDGRYIGFSLWAVDTADFDFSEIPGYGTILEIGLVPDCRGTGLGKKLVAHAEYDLRRKNVTCCYVSAYGPAQKFWSSCGYAANGKTAGNGLPLMTKSL